MTRAVACAAAATAAALALSSALGACAHGPAAPWAQPTAIVESAACLTPQLEAEFAGRARAGVVDELTKSGLAAAAEALSPSLEEVVPAARREALGRASAEGRCRRITYRVDGLRVVGFVFEPSAARPRALPLIVYARGGNRGFGKNEYVSMSLLQTLADAGFVVATTQYRGVDGGEGADQFGGDDVHDLEALMAVARALPAWDGTRAYLYGHSRGGMEAYEALRDGLPVRAAAISGGVADLAQAIQVRPVMESVAAETIPRWATERQQAIEHRSALRWADRITVPLLIVHAREDWRVPLAQAQAMDATLTRLGREHKLLVVEGDAHQIYLHRQALVDALVEWFHAH